MARGHAHAGSLGQQILRQMAADEAIAADQHHQLVIQRIARQVECSVRLSLCRCPKHTSAQVGNRKTNIRRNTIRALTSPTPIR